MVEDGAAEPVAKGPGSLGEIGRQGSLYRRLLGARIRSDWQYRTSFVLFVVAQAAITALEFVTLVVIFQIVPELGGWSSQQVVLLYGLAAVPFALTDALISPVETLPRHVQAGSFDRLLLRPMSALVQLFAMEFELRRMGKLIPTTAVLVWALAVVDVNWSLATIGLVILTLICGSVIYSALWIVTASTAFWVVAATEATNSVTYGGNFANNYPLHVYPGWLRTVLGWTIPLAFVAYVPTVQLLDAPNPLGLPSWFWLLSPLVAVGSVAVALAVWSAGIRRYQGTGS